MAEPAAWTIERGGARVFLFGVRPAGPDDGWLTDRIASAVADADELWRETPPEEEVTASPLLIEYVVSRDATLWEQLDDVTAQRLRGVADELGLDVGLLERVRPWVAAQLVQHATLERFDITPERNMDVVLTRLAERNSVPVRYELDVETVLRTFGHMSRHAELEYLRLLLDAAEDAPALLRVGYAAWSRGDSTLDELGDAIVRQRYPAFYGLLIRARNEAWVPRIDEMLRRPGTRFVAVGTGHLVGPHSILSKVRQLECRVVG